MTKNLPIRPGRTFHESLQRTSAVILSGIRCDGRSRRTCGCFSTGFTPCNRKTAVPHHEEGYILLFAIFLTALLVITLAIAAPQVAKSIQRDKELEAFNRGMQYRRAIQLYYRKFNAYPPNIDALVQTNNIRFLRKKYIDPMTGKEDWKPILFGQNKAPTAMGFFGQPLGGSTIAGIGPGGGNNTGGTGGGILPGGISQMFGGSSTTDTSNANSNNGSNSPNGNGTDSSGNPSGTGGPGSSTGLGQSSTGLGQSSTGLGQSSTGLGQSSQTGPAGQTFGGAGIIGVRLPIEKKSILVYKKKDHYNEWEFTYDPISDQQMMGGANPANPLGGGSPTPTNSPSSTTQAQPTTQTTTGQTY